jgi:hypothetical protein
MAPMPQATDDAALLVPAGPIVPPKSTVPNISLVPAGPVTPPDERDASGMLMLRSELPALERKIIKRQTRMFGGEPTIVDLPESETAYKTRLGEYYGFSEVPEIEAENYGKLQEALSFTPGRVEDMRRIVKKAYGPFADLATHEGYPDPVIRFKSGEIVPFNQPGADMQDIRGLRGGLAPLGSELAGGIAGLPGGIGGVVTGVGAGAFTGEVLRLQKGKDSGYHDLSDPAIYGRAAVDAAIAMGLELTTLGGGAIVRRMISSPAGREIVGDLSEEQLKLAIKAADDYAAETGQKLTAGQSVQEAQRKGLIEGAKDTASEARTIEEALAEMGQAPGLRSQLGAQQTAVDIATREAEVGAAPDLLGSEQVGRDVQAAARADVIQETAEIITAAQTRKEALEEARDAEIKAPELLETSQDLRTYIETGKTKTFEALKKKYQEFHASLDDKVSIDMSDFRKVAAKWEKRVRNDILPKMTGEDRSIIEQALKAGTKRGLTEEGIIKNKGESLPAVFRAISQLKEDKRMLDAGLPSQGRQKALLSDFIDALSEARDTALRDIDPKLSKQLRDLDTYYAAANREIYGSILGRMISKNKQGGYTIRESKLFETLAGEPSEVRRIAALINDPEFSGFGGTSIIKDGFNSLYRDQVIDGTGKHSTFMRKYGASMKEILSPAELKKFDTYQAAQKNIDLIDKIEQQEIKNLKNTIGYKLQGYNAEEVLNKVKGSISKVRDVKRIMAKSPEKWEDFKRLYARDFLDSVMEEGSFGAEFSTKKLGARLKADKGELVEVLGKDYLNGLRWLNKQSGIIGSPPSIRGKASELLKETPALSATLAVWRATVARPLSRNGLLTTGAIKHMRKGAVKALGKLLEDPKNLLTVHQLYVKDAPLRKWRSFFRSIGYNEMVDVMQEKDE